MDNQAVSSSARNDTIHTCGKVYGNPYTCGDARHQKTRLTAGFSVYSSFPHQATFII